MSERGLVLEKVDCKFGNIKILDGVSFDVNKGEFLVIMGPSPSGKSTLLECISGLTDIECGSIYMNGKDIVGVPPQERNISLIFQDLALFVHMNVFDNIAFGLRMKGLPKGEIKKRVEEVMRLVRLEGLGKRRIRQLSGGQQQRVALARSLVINPDIILFDEPIASLDLKLRERMLVELKSLHRELGFTGIYVTHDQQQAMILADRIMVMNKGHIEQLGTPHELYSNPKNVFVATMMGEINLFNGEVLTVDNTRVIVNTDVGKFTARNRGETLEKGEKVFYAVRPDRVLIAEYAKKLPNRTEVKLIEQLYEGSSIKYVTQFIKTSIDFKVSAKGRYITDLQSFIGKNVPIGWNLEDALVLKD